MRMTRKEYTVFARDYLLDLGRATKVMAIINLTPDSFSGDGCFGKNGKVSQKALRLAYRSIQGGADILDIGGESTRPFSKAISVKEEMSRVIPTIKALAQRVKVPISVDTYKTRVAEEALDSGASIVNNIMGTKLNQGLLKMVRNYNAAIVLMHIRGTPQSMQKQTVYKNLIGEMTAALRKSIENCLEIGIKSDKIIIDPGIGFGKTVEQNLEIISRLKEFGVLNKPILIGTSRKSFIGKILNNAVEDRLIGTVASVSASVLNGAHIVRVHDVSEVKGAVRLVDAILNRKIIDNR